MIAITRQRWSRYNKLKNDYNSNWRGRKDRKKGRRRKEGGKNFNYYFLLFVCLFLWSLWSFWIHFNLNFLISLLLVLLLQHLQEGFRSFFFFFFFQLSFFFPFLFFFLLLPSSSSLFFVGNPVECWSMLCSKVSQINDPLWTPWMFLCGWCCSPDKSKTSTTSIDFYFSFSSFCLFCHECDSDHQLPCCQKPHHWSRWSLHPAWQVPGSHWPLLQLTQAGRCRGKHITLVKSHKGNTDVLFTPFVGC